MMNKELVKSTLSNLYTLLCILIVIMGLISVVGVVMGLRPFVMISESMHPEVPKGALVLLDTRSNVTDVEVGDNVAYALGKVVAMHKVVSTSPGSPVSNESANPGAKGENESAGMADSMTTEMVENGENRTLVVRSLADQGESVVTADTYLGKEVLSIPGVGGWIRRVLKYKWIVIIAAAGLIIIGCIPRRKADPQKAVPQNT